MVYIQRAKHESVAAELFDFVQFFFAKRDLKSEMEWLSPSDPSSFSRPDECGVTRFHLEWDVDFKNRSIAGRVRITAKKSSPKSQVLVSKQLSSKRRTVFIHSFRKFI